MNIRILCDVFVGEEKELLEDLACLFSKKMTMRRREERWSSLGGDELMLGDLQGSSGQDERIFVSIRMRPLNEKEIARNEVCDWECINSTTIIFKSNMPDRSMVPSAYNFGRPNACRSMRLFSSFLSF